MGRSLLVSLKEIKRVAELLTKAFPHLSAKQSARRAKFESEGRCYIDVHAAHSRFLKLLKKETITVALPSLRFEVLSPEGAMVLKFDSLERVKRYSAMFYRHAGDFVDMAKSVPDLSEDLLRIYGNLSAEGRGPKIVKMAGDVRAGRRLEL